jgi:beta-lactamase class D OXA-209
MQFIIGTIGVLCLLAGCKGFKDKTIPIETLAFSNIIEASGYHGSILIFDDRVQQYYANDFERCRERFTPASTFKIPNTLIALELGIAQHDEFFKFQWDGLPRWNHAWEKDLSLSEAFQVSCVPCYQELARNAGLENMRNYLKQFQYPGMQVDSLNLDKFWLEGPSAISQFEQIDFLYRFYHQQLPISKNTFSAMKDIFTLEKGDAYTLSAKTGMSVTNALVIGWIVGYLETAEHTYFFATNLVSMDTENWSVMAPVRLALTKDAFKELGIIL